MESSLPPPPSPGRKRSRFTSSTMISSIASKITKENKHHSSHRRHPAMAPSAPGSLDEDHLASADQSHPESRMKKSYTKTQPPVHKKSKFSAPYVPKSLERKSRQPRLISKGSEWPRHRPKIMEARSIKRTSSYESSFGSNATSAMAVDENPVPAVLSGREGQVVEYPDSDEEESEEAYIDSDEDESDEDNEYVRRLFRPKLHSSTKPDFRLCDNCYTTSKDFSYMHIGLLRRKVLAAAKPEDFRKPVSCCVLGAVIDYAWAQSQSISGAETTTVPVCPLGIRVFGSQMEDILLLSDKPMLPALISFLRVNLDQGSSRKKVQLSDAPSYDQLGSLKRVQIYGEETAKTKKYQGSSRDATLKTLTEISLMRDLDSSQVDIALLRNWLHLCEHHHDLCRNRPVREHVNNLSIILVDVIDRRLVKASTSTRYLALSYVWGGTSQYMTTTGALSTLKAKNSLRDIEDQIPPGIQDAIEVVAKMGERYLWVDALCIIHDDQKQKHHQIAQMSSVYHHAILTIVSLDGNDASVGLPGFQPQSRHRDGLVVAPGIRLCQRTRKLSDLISKSVYNTRAWTYQERLLSRRCLFFTKELVYFQCGTQVNCEDRMEPLAHDHRLVAPLGRANASKVSTTSRLLEDDFPYYAHFVVDYSRKKLSYQSDIINAFSGITRMLELRHNWRFLGGLPITLMDLALLWAPSSSDPSRDVNSQRRCDFPTWTWAGWSGGVDYELIPISGLRSELESVYVEDRIGCYEMTGRVPELLRGRPYNRTEHEAANLFKPNADALDFWESAKIIHCKAYTTPAEKFTLQGANPHHYFTEGHIFQGVTYQQTSLILDTHGDHCGTLYGIDVSTIGNSSELQLEFVLLSSTLRHSRSLHYADPDLEIQPHGLRPDASGQPGYYEGKIYDQKYHDAKYICKMDSRWSVLNVLLVSVQNGSSERLAIGQIHVTAWRNTNPVKAHVTLI